MYLRIMLIHKLVFSSHEMLMLFAEWDANFATEAYRQQVEALAQHQVRLTNATAMSFCISALSRVYLCL